MTLVAAAIFALILLVVFAGVDVTITAANVAPVVTGNNPTQYGDRKLAGEALAAGDVVYLKAADDKYWKADANASVDTAAAKGIVMQQTVAVGQHLQPATGGEITIGGTIVAGQIYVVSANAGKVCPAADLASTHWSTRLGTAKTVAVFTIDISISGIQLA